MLVVLGEEDDPMELPFLAVFGLSAKKVIYEGIFHRCEEISLISINRAGIRYRAGK